MRIVKVFIEGIVKVFIEGIVKVFMEVIIKAFNIIISFHTNAACTTQLDSKFLISLIPKFSFQTHSLIYQ